MSAVSWAFVQCEVWCFLWGCGWIKNVEWDECVYIYLNFWHVVALSIQHGPEGTCLFMQQCLSQGLDYCFLIKRWQSCWLHVEINFTCQSLVHWEINWMSLIFLTGCEMAFCIWFEFVCPYSKGFYWWIILNVTTWSSGVATIQKTFLAS